MLPGLANLCIDGFVQEKCNSIANTLEFRLSCTNPSICERGLNCWIIQLHIFQDYIRWHLVRNMILIFQTTNISWYLTSFSLDYYIWILAFSVQSFPSFLGHFVAILAFEISAVGIFSSLPQHRAFFIQLLPLKIPAMGIFCRDLSFKFPKESCGIQLNFS